MVLLGNPKCLEMKEMFRGPNLYSSFSMLIDKESKGFA